MILKNIQEKKKYKNCRLSYMIVCNILKLSTNGFLLFRLFTRINVFCFLLNSNNRRRSPDKSPHNNLLILWALNFLCNMLIKKTATAFQRLQRSLQRENIQYTFMSIKKHFHLFITMTFLINGKAYSGFCFIKKVWNHFPSVP